MKSQSKKNTIEKQRGSVSSRAKKWKKHAQDKENKERKKSA